MTSQNNLLLSLEKAKLYMRLLMSSHIEHIDRNGVGVTTDCQVNAFLAMITTLRDSPSPTLWVITKGLSRSAR